MPLPHKALVLVIDGGKQLFLRNHGDGQQIDLRVEAHDAQAIGSDGDIKTDAAGQSGNSSMGETDYHQQAEDRWVVAAAETLNKRALANDFDALAIIAAPKALGVLRPKLHKEVEKRVVLELAKDMTNRPVSDIEALLVSETASPA